MGGSSWYRVTVTYLTQKVPISIIVRREGTAIDQPQVILDGRELEAVEKGWGERHPWADERDGWEGLVMLYTPQSEAELEIIFQLIVESYNFITGQHEVPSDYFQF